MAKNEPTTKPTNKDISEFIEEIENKTKQEDSKILLKIFKKITKQPPIIWGTKIVGFDTYQYESKTCKGNWPIIGFAPNKAKISIYIMNGFSELKLELEKLGKHKTSVGCLYINKLADIDIKILEQIIDKSYKIMKKRYK